MSEVEIHSNYTIFLTVKVVASFVTNNSLPVSELPALIQSVHDALIRVAKGDIAHAEPETNTPAVPIRKSITPEYLICLDDGLRFKSMKRHIGKLGMTPDQYREKWKLPGDYPMVAPTYAATRSALAKKIGLGHSQKGPATETERPKGKRGRPRKVTP
jgi:predicted transcriptional regulator